MSEPIRLLYAEDNPQDADLTRAYFEREATDIHLEIVETGARCLARLAEQSFDLLLLDYHLPDMDGLAVLAKLRAEGRTLPVVMITGAKDDETVIRVMHAGATDYVLKSEGYLATLHGILRRVVARQRSRSLVDGGSSVQRAQRILYVEPNPMDAELTMGHFATTAPHLQLHIVTSCIEALALLIPGHGFDLALTDLRVPGMNALEFMREAQQRGIELPFIVITGKGDESMAVAILRLGAYDYIVKREGYLTQLPHSIDHALHRFHLDQTTRRLNAELAALNVTLEQKIIARTAEAEASRRSTLEILERVSDAFVALGRDWRYTHINTQGAALFGRTPEQLIGKHIWTEFPEGVGQPFYRAYEQALADQKSVMFEDYYAPWDKWFENRVYPSTGGLSIFFHDITARKRAELALRKSEVSYRNLIENTHDLVQSVDPDGNIIFVNTAWCKVLGWTREEAMQLNFSRIIRPDQLAHCQNIFSELKRGKNFSQIEITFVTKDGHETILECNLNGIFEDGTFVGTQSFFRDISERKNTEAHLRLAAKVFEQSNEAFMITDAYRNIVMVNPAFTTITGYSEAEALGKSPRLLYSGKQDQDFYRTMWESINTLGYWQGEILDRRKDGSIYPKWLSISRVHDSQDNITHYIGIFSDISQHKRDEAHIQKLAHFDALTELPNRVLLNDRITLALSAAQRNRTSLAVMFVDLDHFKNVNDTLGHRIGDALLIEVAKRMKTVVREDDTVSRLGGDEFIFVLPGTDITGAAHVAEKLLETVSQRYQIEQHELIITPSIGIAIYPNDGDNFESLSQCADIAMYRAKRDGRNNYRFFTPEMQASSVRTLQLENTLHHAIKRNELHLHYQPQISLQDGRIIGVEALLRWQHPEFGKVSPAEFIPIAEDSGQILQIGEWVLRTAVRQLKTWIDNGMTPMTMAVNLSVVQFRHLNLPDMVSQILDEVQLSAQYLELELTEGVAMDDPVGAIAVMDKLHNQGIRMSLDDFGTGYSSLNYLKRFRIYKLKIDQSFVRDITIDPDDKAIVSAVISMANSLEMLTIAEGVETEGQLAYLREQGCNEVQGYYFCHPLPADQLEIFIKTTRSGLNGKKKK